MSGAGVIGTRPPGPPAAPGPGPDEEDVPRGRRAAAHDGETAGDDGARVAAEPAAHPLKKLFVRGTLWTLVGNGSEQVVRLAANLVLARLLVRDDFGLMLLVTVFQVGLSQLSDVGIRASIIQDREGEDRRFLDTAWTLQVLRGAGLWLVSVALAVPYATFYEKPELGALVMVAGSSSLVAGFTSTRMHLQERRVMLGRLLVIQLATQFSGIAVMIGWALVSPTVWALVAGGIVQTAVKVVLSHTALPGERDRFAWDRECARRMMRFGRWIFLGTAMGFLAGRGDRLFVGKLLDAGTLGAYSIAVQLSALFVNVIAELSSKVLFPVYARLASVGADDLRRRFLPIRASLLALVLPPLCGLVVWGQEVVDLLWPEQFAEAGWMLRLLCAGAVLTVVNETARPVFLAVGDSATAFLVRTVRVAMLAAAMGVGTALHGFPGCLVGVAVAPLLEYPVLAWATRRHHAWLPRLDALAVGGSAAFVLLGLWISGGL